MNVYVLPMKRGTWRVARMTDIRHERWSIAWHKWWERIGKRLAISPEMWQTGDDILTEASRRATEGEG